MGKKTFKILSVGSINCDICVATPKIPLHGETVFGQDVSISLGGKGANQACQAQKLFPYMERNQVALIGKIGKDDQFKTQILKELIDSHLDITNIRTSSSKSSGIALITLSTETNENTIIVVPGANFQFSVDDLNSNIQYLIQNCNVILLQNEIPQKTTLEAMKIASSSSPKKPFIIFNPSPVDLKLQDEFFRLPHIIVVNKVETLQYSNLGSDTCENIENKEFLLRTFKAKRGCSSNVIMTCGGEGCYLMTDTNEYHHFPVNFVSKNDAVDTTGAGDSFIGALSFFLTELHTLTDSVQLAQRVASLSIKKHGTVQSYLSREDLENESWW